MAYFPARPTGPSAVVEAKAYAQSSMTGRPVATAFLVKGHGTPHSWITRIARVLGVIWSDHLQNRSIVRVTHPDTYGLSNVFCIVMTSVGLRFSSAKTSARP